MREARQVRKSYQLRPLICALTLVSLGLMLHGCSNSPMDNSQESWSTAGSYVPAAVVAQPLDFPKDEDVRKLPTEPGLSNASCGLNSESGIEDELIQRINAWRAEARYCGSKLYSAVPPLRWNLKLQNAAYHHSVEMARANLISHVSIDSRELWNRVRQTGYAFSRVSENIAAGQTQVVSVMEAWQKSPAHCAAMMEEKLEEVGVVCIHKPSSFYKFYWTMDMASPLVAPKELKQELEKQEKTDKSRNRNPFLRIADEVKKF